jgi:hypothetical protein
MIATEHTLSLAEFRENATETIERLKQTDVAVIERSMKQIKEGKFEEAGVLFDRLHANLLAMKAAQSQGTTK